MSGRQQAEHNRRTELLALVGLAAVEGEWRGAVQVAEALRMPWRPLAYALRRLVERGVVAERFETVRGSARTKEQVRLYKFGDGARNPFELRVVPPRPGVARRVRGRAGMAERWERG